MIQWRSTKIASRNSKLVGPTGAAGVKESFQISAPSISLPKGGGAIRGMGEKFAANPVTGTGSMTVPIATSPGRSGFGPQLYFVVFRLWHIRCPQKIANCLDVQITEEDGAMNAMTGITRSPDWVKRSLMKIVKRISLLMISAVAISGSSGLAQTVVPSDPDVACSVPATTVNGWFKSGTAALNGVVNPANSVSFPNSPNCSFYEWSYQMFLWLTSPAPAIYGGGGGRIFGSSAFFDVSPPDANGKRTMSPHEGGLLSKFDVFNRQVGPNRLPLVFDKQGRMFAVQSPPRGQLPRVLTKSGQLTEIAKVRIGENRQVILLNRQGAQIQPQLLPPPREPRALPRPSAAIPIAQKFRIGGIAIFLDRAGNIIEVEQGQADAAVLIAKNESPIYYGIAVNEVMAYFRTMQGASVPPNLLFPTTQGELDNITTFASSRGKTFVDPEALAFEIKTSWIEAAGIPNPGDYITMTADIPTYDKKDPLKWVKNGNKTATVAMVGMHVVGSAAGHPEMIWATFEHVGNTPNDAYSYRNSGGGTTQVAAQNTAGNWLFCATPCAGPFNQQRQFLSGDDIVASSPLIPIGPDNIIRRKAWGAAFDVNPNPLKNPAASNSEIISVNNTVRAVLDPMDVRRNYIMTGSTWMIAGMFPFTTFNTTEVGTSKSNNSTMETFTQGPDNLAKTPMNTPNGTNNCFTCHGGKTTSVSHVFGDLKPLP